MFKPVSNTVIRERPIHVPLVIWERFLWIDWDMSRGTPFLVTIGMSTEVRRARMEKVHSIRARILHEATSFSVQDAEESLGNIPGVGIGAFDASARYAGSAAVAIHISVVPFESAFTRNSYRSVLALVRVPNTLVLFAILRDGDTVRA